MANEEVLGSRKTMFVLVIVVGCFAVLWPRILGPLLLGPAAKPGQFDRDAGCCEVIFESEVAVLELVNEVCSSAVGSDGKMSPIAANECRKTVNETCGLDIAAFLKRSDNVGKSTKALLQTMKQSNSSCLKEHFGVPVWSLGVHTALNSWTQQDTMKQERSPIRAGPHPALRERGRAIPVNAPTPPSRGAVPMPPHARVRSPLSVYFEHEVSQPPPIPGMRPPLGSPGGPVPAPKSSMGFVMPIYTICIIVFFVYTLSKILFKRTGSIPYEQVSPDPHFRRRVFRDDSRSSPETKLGHKERDAIVTAISGLVAEVHQQMEANYAQSQQRQEAENHARPYTNGSVLKSSPIIVASEFVEQKEKSPEPEKPKEASPEPEKPSEKSPSPELSPEKELEPELSPEKESDLSPEKGPEPTSERSSPEKELSPEESPEREPTPDNVESNLHRSGPIEDDLLKLTEDIKEKKENLARSTEDFLNDAKESLKEAEDEALKDEEGFSNEAEDEALKDEEEFLNEAEAEALKDEEEFLNDVKESKNEANEEAVKFMNEAKEEGVKFMNEAREEAVKLLKEALNEDSEEEEEEDEPEPDVSVKVVGMELTAHAAGGAPPAPPALAPPPAQRSHEADEVKSIFLETRIPQQSRVLVAEFEDRTKPAPRRHDPMVVSGKMTLSLIQDAPRDTPERDPESTVTDFTTASAMTQPVAEKDGESSGEEIEEEIEIEEIEEEEEEKKPEANETN